MGHGKEAKLYHDIQYFNIGLSTDVNAFIHGNWQRVFLYYMTIEAMDVIQTSVVTETG